MRKKVKKIIGFKFVRYLMVGTSSVLMENIIYATLIYAFHFHPIPSKVVSFPTSVAYNFFMTNYWTFGLSGKKKATKAGKYTLVAIINYILNLVLLSILIKFLSPIISNLIITGLQVSWNFLIYKFWIFKDESVPAGDVA